MKIHITLDFLQYDKGSALAGEEFDEAIETLQALVDEGLVK